MIVLYAIIANRSYIMYRECQRILYGSAIYVCCSATKPIAETSSTTN